MTQPWAEAWWADGDDAARLVHADALSTAGDPRGEFIYLQCTDPTAARVGALWTEHHRAWLSELELPNLSWAVKGPGLSSAMFGAKSGLEVWTAKFERGFLTRLWAPRLSERLADALTAHATLRQLELDDWDLDATLAHVARFHLESLGVHGATQASAAAIARLADTRVFLELGELSFNAGTEDADTRAEWVLAAVEPARRLTRLTLSGVLGSKTLQRIARLGWTARLTHLDVSTRDATEELPALLQHLPRLEALTLHVHHARVELAEALLAHPRLKTARVHTSAPTELPTELGVRLRARLGPEALVRF